MNRRQYNWLFLIIPLMAIAIWVDVSKQITIPNPFNTQSNLVDRNVDVQLGLDLRGGLQVLLEADVPANASVSSDDLNVTRQILESRANALGVSEVVMQVAPPRRLVAEFPGLQDPGTSYCFITADRLARICRYGYIACCSRDDHTN